MDKKILSLILSGVLFSPLVVSADLQVQEYGHLTIWNLLPNIETAVWIIFCAIVVICFVVSGVLFLSAQGDPEKVKTARSAFIWGVAGVIVGIIAYSITTIMLNYFT